jgi:signal transduction histidine kinase
LPHSAWCRNASTTSPKHSEASAVNLSLHRTDGLLRLNVEDDGVGFEVKGALEKQNSFGLAGMRERVALLGGKMEITSRLRRGTTISVELPVRTVQQKGP